MMGDIELQDEIEILEDTYYHKLTIYRTIEYKEHGATKEREEKIFPENISCALSYNSNHSSFNLKENSMNNQIIYPATIFCNPTTDIKAGDKCIITFEDNSTREFKAGDRFYYPTHLQVPVSFEGEA